MAVNKPEPAAPLASKDGKDGQFDSWLFRFWSWVTTKLQALLDADIVVGTASTELTNERVATDTTSIDVTLTTGVIQWSIIDEYVQDLVGAMIVDSAEIDFTYNDGAGTTAGLLIVTGVTAAGYGSASAVATFTVDTKGRLTAAATVTIAIASTQVTDFTEAVQDVAGAFATDSTTVDFTYNDGANTLSAAVITQMSITADASGIKLVSDETSPGNNKVYGTDGSGTKGWQDAPSSDGMTKNIALSTHGFSVGNWLYHTGSTWALADSDAVVTAEAIGIVKTVTDTDNFVLQLGGYITGLSGLTAGSAHFLSGTPGALTTTEPTADGKVSKPLLVADSTTTGYIFNWRGQVIGGGVAGVREVTSGTATAGQTTINVNYTPGYVDVFVNGVRVMPDDFTATNGTSIVLDTGMALNDEFQIVVWTVTSTSLLSAPVPPQGRLTLTTATPVMTAEAAAQTTIYYTPYVGDLIPIYDGTTWSLKRFTELSIAMAASANWAAGKNFDLFVYNDAGTLRLVSGAAWTNDTTRAEALLRLNGIWVNNASFTGRYGASSTVTIAAQLATYVGTFRTSANGTTTWEIGGAADNGDEIRLFIWNAYNRVVSGSACRDATDSWTYATATWAALNASNTNRASFVRGLNEDGIWGDLSITVAPPPSSNAGAGIGLDSTSALWTYSSVGIANASGAQNAAACSGAYAGVPGLGYHFVQALQYAAAATATYYGDAGTTYFQDAFTFNGRF